MVKKILQYLAPLAFIGIIGCSSSLDAQNSEDKIYPISKSGNYSQLEEKNYCDCIDTLIELRENFKELEKLTIEERKIIKKIKKPSINLDETEILKQINQEKKELLEYRFSLEQTAEECECFAPERKLAYAK